MIKIYSDGDLITCTQGDTFLLDVEAADGFAADSKLTFQVSLSESEQPVIDRQFELTDNFFRILLMPDETKLLSIGNYIYRLILSDKDGSVITKKSGELEIKWGA